MSVNIQELPTDELRGDLEDSLSDIRTCELALLHGIETYSGGGVQERLDANKRFITVITAELQRRGAGMTKQEAYEAYWSAVAAQSEAWKVYEKAHAKTVRAQAREDVAFAAFSEAVAAVSEAAKRANGAPA